MRSSSSPNWEDNVNVVEAVQAIVHTYPEATIVSSLGTATSAARHVTGDGPHFYFGAAMGSALAGALGLAEAAPHRQVVAVLGDGDFLMGANSLWSLSACRPTNLLVVVLADGAYSITGGQTISCPLRLAEVGAALEGLSGATADTAEALRAELTSLPQPGLIEARISESVWPGPSPFVDPAEVVRSVRASLATR
ncbi:thiamine pyrophosphate-dependent enzyme [Tamaricihabitans halophyticus]|uniref:Thiamine pyrophosphate-dependent enzyme n=1 Tax=Tamaricihabitans halophyticus TaxID=1262583 RepID=A0A4R2PYT0_9PSEU|nr:thiamine pyrophosphate-dependent enzyme [Tamaricihabitans halophyticus]TCP39371.1 thiamine pyrophosphate-dependent enzyme [Tamaricihabitans halophyticus]